MTALVVFLLGIVFKEIQWGNALLDRNSIMLCMVVFPLCLSYIYFFYFLYRFKIRLDDESVAFERSGLFGTVTILFRFPDVEWIHFGLMSQMLTIGLRDGKRLKIPDVVEKLSGPEAGPSITSFDGTGMSATMKELVGILASKSGASVSRNATYSEF